MQRAVLALLLLGVVAVSARPVLRPHQSRPTAPGANPYNEQTAKYAVKLCALAYSDFPQNCNLTSPTMTVTASFNNSFLGFGTFVFTAVDTGLQQIIIAVRGTNSITQLIEEALTSVIPVPFRPNPSFMVNSYFYGCEGLWYTQLKAEVQSLIQQNPSYSVFITGHSLGGAVATITAMHLMYDGVLTSEPTIYTFGEPRVGDYAFAQQYNTFFPSAYRVVHYKDIVAHLPPCHASLNSKLQYVCDTGTNTFEWAYQHGTEVWYQESMPDLTDGSQGSFQTCTGAPFGEDPGCSDGLLLKDSVTDHTHYYLYFGVPFDIGQFCLSEDELVQELPIIQAQPDTIDGVGAN